MEDALFEKEAMLEAMANQICLRSSALDLRESALAEAEANVVARAKTVSKSESDVKAREEKCASEELELADKQGNLQTWERLLATMESKLEREEEALAGRKRKLAESESSVKQRELMLEQRAESADSKEKKLAQTEEALAQKSVQLVAGVESLKSKTVAIREESARLEAGKAEMEAMQAELAIREQAAEKELQNVKLVKLKLKGDLEAFCGFKFPRETTLLDNIMMTLEIIKQVGIERSETEAELQSMRAELMLLKEEKEILVGRSARAKADIANLQLKNPVYFSVLNAYDKLMEVLKTDPEFQAIFVEKAKILSEKMERIREAAKKEASL
jgi:hypothetical protein